MQVSSYGSYSPQMAAPIAMIKGSNESTAESVKKLLDTTPVVDMRPGVGKNVNTYA